MVCPLFFHGNLIAIRLLRVSRRWSQETLAEIAGLDRTFVGAVERAERNITLATAEKLAKAFDLMVADLLTPYREDWER